MKISYDLLLKKMTRTYIINLALPEGYYFSGQGPVHSVHSYSGHLRVGTVKVEAGQVVFNHFDDVEEGRLFNQMIQEKFPEAA